MTIRCLLCGCVPSIDKLDESHDIYFCSNPVLAKCPLANTEFTATQWQSINIVKPDLFSTIYAFESLSDKWEYLGLIKSMSGLWAQWRLINSKGPVEYGISITEKDNLEDIIREAFIALDKTYNEAVKQDHFVK